MSEKIIIVGNGITAISAIKAIREFDKESEIKLFGDEKFYPYNRIRLSKGLLTSLDEEKILLQKKEWYEQNNIKLYLHTKVISVNTSSKEIETSDGSKVSYTKLLLANGANNLIPDINGINKEGVFSLRTLEDARNIVQQSNDSEVILNIGAGILSLELAWILAQAGKKVIITELAPRLMPRQLDERASQILEKAIKNKNIDILINSQISEISVREDKVEGVITDSGKFFPCDMVIYSIGIKPNVDIVQGTNIKVNKGIIVNEKMETEVTDIYAGGDVAEYNNRVYGLWNIAIGQGTVAGHNMVGKDSTYKSITPVTTLNAFDISLFSMGDIEEDESTNILLEDTGESNSYKKIFIKDNRITGAIVIGDTKISPILKRAIEEQIYLGTINLDNVYINELIQTIKNNKY